MQQEAKYTATDPIEDACLRAEAGLQEVRKMLLEARPDAIDRCHNELQRIVAMLEGVVAEGAFPRTSSVSSALLRIRRSGHLLSLQIEYASNLCLGWIQLRLGAGYTERGLPVLVTSDSSRSFEA